MPYLTPNAPPDETVCRVIRIPKAADWLSIVDGALSELMNAYRFEAYGDYSPDDTASKFMEIYDDYVSSDCADIMSGCCYDTVERRVDADGNLQISVNGGDWVTDPADPRITGVSLPPPVIDASHTKCDAATNARQHIEDLNAQHSNDLSIATTVWQLVALIAAEIVALVFLPEAAPIIIPIILGTIPALFALGQAGFDAYWISDNYDIVLCALYHNIGDDGQFTDAQYADFLSDIGGLLPSGVPRDMLYRDIVAMGVKGLNNISAYGSSAEADCSGCDSTCNLDDWSIAVLDGEDIGVETGRGLGYIEIQGHSHHSFGGVGYVAMLTTDASNHCCVIDHIEAIEGTSFAGAYWVNCNDPLYPTTDVTFQTFPQSGEKNGIQFRDSSPFTVRVFFA